MARGPQGRLQVSEGRLEVCLLEGQETMTDSGSCFPTVFATKLLSSEFSKRRKFSYEFDIPEGLRISATVGVFEMS